MVSAFKEVWANGSGGSAAFLLAILLTVLLVAAWGIAQAILTRGFDALDGLGERSTVRIRSQLQRLTSTLRVATSGGVFLFLTLFYVPSVLRLFVETRDLARDWNGILERKSDQVLSETINYLPKLILLLGLFVATRVVLGLLKQIFLSIESKQIVWGGFEPAWARPTFQLTRVIVVLFAVILAFPYLPASDTEAFKAIGVMAGVLLSFGSTGAVANATAGLALTYERAFREGDYVSLFGHEGVVERIGVLTTRIRTLKNECVVLPNQGILSSSIVNYNYFETGVAVTASVTIGYDVDWRKIHQILGDAARRFREMESFVCAERPPRLLQTALNDFHVGYSVEVFVTKLTDRRLAETALHRAVRDAFDEAGVAIPSPALTNVRLVGPEERSVAPSVG